MNNLKPNVIFSAHDHRAAMATSRLNDSFFDVNSFFDQVPKVRKEINDRECVEVIWPTCSYRMGVDKAGYGFATIGIFIIVIIIKFLLILLNRKRWSDGSRSAVDPFSILELLRLPNCCRPLPWILFIMQILHCSLVDLTKDNFTYLRSHLFV